MSRVNIPYLITVVTALLFVIIGHAIVVRDAFLFQTAAHETARATVRNVIERHAPEGFYDFAMFQGEIIIFEAEITRGNRRGSLVTVSQALGDFALATTREVGVGDRVLLLFNEDIGEWFFDGYLRTNRLLVLAILFTLSLLIFGGKKGFNTMLSLALTCGAVFGVFIPAILAGKNIHFMTLLVCAYTITMTLLLVVGFNKKAFAAAIGCASGLAVTGIIALVMDGLLFLTGVVDEHSRFLTSLPGGIAVDLRAIIFAGIMIGAMGAIMDVALSISSSLWEIKEKAKSIKFDTLYRSGVNIGRDIMGSMANTLILAYIGTSLSVVLLLAVFSDSLFGLLNSEMIVVEILKSLSGILGILFAMPLTAFFCAVLYLRKDRQ
jgi:uncharacterized membrane protein